MDAKQETVHCALLAVAVLLAGLAGGLVWPGLRIVFAGAGFVGYVWLSSRVVRGLDADRVVFATRAQEERRRAARTAVRAGLAAGTIGAFIVGRSASVPPVQERRRRPRPGWVGFPHPASPKTR
ncbi:MAG TPA: hypothetical protein VKG23_14330 [Thermoanaerobaculia bacterium]|nr:hypothetical protein [Thermoanaerobaculia bacterium]